MRTKLLLFSCFLALLLNSCINVKLVPEYSAAIENEIIATQKLNEKLYTDMLSVPEQERQFSKFENKYLEVESNISSIDFQTKTREKNENFVAMVTNLKKHFIKYKEEHKTKVILKNGEIETYIESINAFYQPMLLAEKSLKNVKK